MSIEGCRRLSGPADDHRDGGGPPQVLAYVIAWALFAFQRLLLWEIPFMPARFVWFRAAVTLPFPFLAAAIAMVIGRP